MRTEEPRLHTEPLHGERIRVLHAIQNLNYGGMERLIAEMVRRSDAERFEHHVLALQYIGRFGRELEGMAGLHLAAPMGRASMLRPRSLAGQIRALRPHVVHSHSGVWYKATRAARMAGVPTCIHTEHGRRAPDPWADRLVDGLASRRTDVVVAVSAPLAAHLRRRVVHGGARVEVIANGVDADAFRPRRGGPVRAELGLGPSIPVLGSIGRLEPIKGYEVMVEALALLPTLPGAEPPVLVLAGDGSERARLTALAGRRGVADRVRFLGWRDDVHDLHAAFDLFTMSSHSEGTSVSLLEAMSAGLAPVVTAVGGNPDVLDGPLRDTLVPPANPAALAAAWAAALADPAARAARGRAARERVRIAYSLDATVRGYEALYAGALPASRPTVPKVTVHA
jgi:glycosyltransferase involved in cell wall biosynthesis